MKNLLMIGLVLMVVAMGSSVRAELATSVEMEQVCVNWLTHMVDVKGNWSGSQTPSIVAFHDILVGDTLVARWYDIAPKGYVLVSVLKEMTPVKAYSDVSSLDASQEGGFLAMIRESSGGLLRRYVQEYGTLEAKQPATGEAIFGQGQRAKWDELAISPEQYRSSLRATKRAAVSEAGPLVTSAWHQRYPYYNLCPSNIDGRCVVGCVATAAAQILKYWQWPPNGYGSHSYTWNGDQSCGHNYAGGTLSADFSGTIDWANIPDSCPEEGCTPEQEAALAQLCYNVGVAFNMDYGACGSAASVAYASYVFPTYYKYSTEARVEKRADYDLEGWFDLVQREIDSGRVIDYRINLHSIVCDGYRQDGSSYQYHMNYGWGGSHNAWYVLDSLYCYWKPQNLCPAAEEFMVTHIMPQTKAVLQFVGSALEDSVGNKDGHAQAGETIKITPTIRNAGLDATGVQGTLTSSDPYLTILTGSAGFSDLGWGDQAISQSPFVVQVSPSCPDPHIAEVIISVETPSGTGTGDTVLVFVGNKPGFADDMEAGQGLWRHRIMTPQYREQWHLEGYRYHGGATSWKMGGEGSANYADGCEAGLLTPPVLLPEKAKLTFWHRIDAEQLDDSVAWDCGVVMISTGPGQWMELTPVGGYPYKLNLAGAFPANTPCYSGSRDWAKAEFDLSSYSGVRQILFWFFSDDAVNAEGWYIDDVLVTGCCDETRGNVNTLGITDLSDLSCLVSYLTGGGYVLPCESSANVNGTGIVDLSDLSSLVSYLTGGGYSLPACP